MMTLQRILALVFLLGLAACGGQADRSAPSTERVTVTPVTALTAAVPGECFLYEPCHGQVQHTQAEGRKNNFAIIAFRQFDFAEQYIAQRAVDEVCIPPQFRSEVNRGGGTVYVVEIIDDVVI